MLNGVVRRLNGSTTKAPHQYLISVSAYGTLSEAAEATSTMTDVLICRVLTQAVLCSNHLTDLFIINPVRIK